MGIAAWGGPGGGFWGFFPPFSIISGQVWGGGGMCSPKSAQSHPKSLSQIGAAGGGGGKGGSETAIII